MNNFKMNLIQVLFEKLLTNKQQTGNDKTLFEEKMKIKFVYILRENRNGSFFFKKNCLFWYSVKPALCCFQ